MSRFNGSPVLTKQVRRTFTDKFQRDAVSLVTDQSYSFVAAARSPGLHPGLIHK